MDIKTSSIKSIYGFPEQNRNKNAWVFDMDDTLIIPHREKTKEHLYMILFVKKDNHVMMNLFNYRMKKDRYSVYILTGRHHDLADEISGYFKIDKSNVNTRDFCLSLNEVKKVDNDDKFTEDFLDKLIRFKSMKLNKIADLYSTVIFFDDLAKKFDKKFMADNILILLPF
ncbi:MAG: hypothetical protein ACTSWY_06920 [Promethearchaeota archaeon]